MSGQWHPDPEELAEYREGLAGGRRSSRRLTAHVADCARCASVSDQLAAVSSALASAPAPPLPDAVERRIAATLAAETAGRQASPEMTGSPADGARAHGGAPGPRRHPHRAGSGRRTPWLRPAVLLSAAAACLLLFGLVYVLGYTGMSSSSSSPEASGASSAIPSGAAGPAPAAGGALTPGRESAAGPRSAPFAVIESGTSYQKSTLAAQVRAQLAAGTAGAASSPSATQPFKEAGGTAATAAPSAELIACALHLTGNVVPSLVDRASYEGQPAYVIAVPGHAWVVGLNCTAADPALIASADLLPAARRVHTVVAEPVGWLRRLVRVRGGYDRRRRGHGARERRHGPVRMEKKSARPDESIPDPEHRGRDRRARMRPPVRHLRWEEMNRRPLRSAIAAALAVAAAAAFTACSAAPAPATSYYLALGDSLSLGVQPNAAGASVPTSEGYPDLVYARLRDSHPALRLVQLGCPEETTKTMMHGGICRYPAGSQLAAAVAFLRAHRGHVLLVTMDIGANDPEACGNQPSLSKLASCIGKTPEAAANLATILASLRAAAGPGVRIVGMSYYLPALAEWRNGTLGQAVARVSARLAAAYNGLLGRAYAQAGIGVADVFGAFDTANFGDPVTVPGIGSLPRNVALICQWTWACAPPPRGPNQHANPAGYRVIAGTVLKTANLG